VTYIGMRRVVTVFLTLTGIALAATYEVRPEKDTSFALTVAKTGLMRGKKHLFLFERFQGTLQYDSQHPETAGIQLTIDSRSALCKDAWVSAKDLRKISQVALEDMLAATRYPTMTFTSSEIKALGGDRYVAQGMLVIRGISKPVEVNVQLRSANPTMLWVEGSATIRLSDYGLKPPSAILGAIGTEDAMALDFRLAASPVK